LLACFWTSEYEICLAACGEGDGPEVPPVPVFDTPIVV
jgi:hypothetical protein